MIYFRFVSISFLALLLSGCVSFSPELSKSIDQLNQATQAFATAQKMDPVQEDVAGGLTKFLQSGSGQTTRSDLAIVVTSGTKTAMDQLANLHQLNKAMVNFTALGDLDPQKIYADLGEALVKRYGNARVFNSLDEAAASGAGLIFPLDLNIQFATMSGQETVVHMTGNFMNKNRTVIETVEGEARHKMPYPASTYRFMNTWKEALDQFLSKLDASTKLRRGAVPPSIETQGVKIERGEGNKEGKKTEYRDDLPSRASSSPLI